jgi:hypothetical protein
MFLKKLIICIIAAFSTPCFAFQAIQIDETGWHSGSVFSISDLAEGICLMNSLGLMPDSFNSSILMPFWVNTSGQIYPDPTNSCVILTGPGGGPAGFCQQHSKYEPRFSLEITGYLPQSSSSLQINIGNSGFVVLLMNQTSIQISTGSGSSYNPPITHFVNLGAQPFSTRITKAGDYWIIAYRKPNSTWEVLQNLNQVIDTTNIALIGWHWARVDKIQFGPFQPTGYWHSPIYDLGARPIVDGQIHWSVDTPPGTSVKIMTQTAPEDAPENWSAWAEPIGTSYGSIIASPRNRYLRVCAILNADTTQEFTPVLKQLSINYPKVKPLAPLVQSSTHGSQSWGNASQALLSWSQPAGDPVTVSRYYVMVDAAVDTLSPYCISLPGTVTAQAFSGLAEGSHSFHVRALGDHNSGDLLSDETVFGLSQDSAAPQALRIDSPTHLDNLPANNNAPVFNLSCSETGSGLAGYACSLDHDPDGVPNRSGALSGAQVSYSGLANGQWWFHACAVDRAGNASAVASYSIRVDYTGEILSERHAKVAPNPVRSDVISLDYELSAEASSVGLELLGPSGTVLARQSGGCRPGRNQVRFDASGAANGVYFCRIQAVSATDGKKSTVVKKIALVR